MKGNEAVCRGAVAAGCKAFFGYPITPSSEIMHFWAGEASSEQGKKDGLVFLQAEDEVAAGFMVIGGVLAGMKTFTASAGPGNVLLQDGFSMAEAMRFPVVAYIMQRGGPSTSTVIYSQSEVNLTCFGGNGNGYRIVYSPSSIQDLYDYGIKVFNTAWKYRFPTFLLGDGYLAKTMSEVEIYDPAERGIKMEPTEAYMLEKTRTRPLPSIVPSPELEIRTADGVDYDCMRNCLNFEEETATVNREILEAFEKAAPEIMEWEEYGPKKAKKLIVAHGIVAAASKAAVDESVGGKSEARLFRPITLRPFPIDALRKAAEGAEVIVVPESALGQFARFVKDALYGHCSAKIIELSKPSMGILPEEIAAAVNAATK